MLRNKEHANLYVWMLSSIKYYLYIYTLNSEENEYIVEEQGK